MSSGYEIVQKLTDISDTKLQKLGRVHAYLILISLGSICSVLFWIVTISSVLACFIALVFGVVYTHIVRPDLWKISIGSGFVMLLCSLPFYGFLIVVAPEWIEVTYPFDVLTGLRIYNVPVEEFIFWFSAGMVFGPFYEVMNGLKERKR